ncbi:hypothetical protein ABB30_01845 [Stenotrophomonas ginsengisoli]|uniref:AB hydrolase-1 domain-containing protein n=1 Tax=Stenotrophomonas ginsengisoli TaxID=336566 RepID=A0A0R0DA77_9GAMM|nr:alpha/beta hydrolase [Stenotrophomonas ginsengisoli]KRG79167.1 hypothetical protein ABB30_01845 [Stenotrophomonas ginsengisoli]
MSKHLGAHRLMRLLLVTVLLGMGSGCAMVKMRTVATPDFTAAKRSDVLSSGKLGHATQEALQVIGIDPATCVKQTADCISQMGQRPGVSNEVRLAALAELWTLSALAQAEVDRKAGGAASQIAGDAWLETARYAYAYLFFSGRTPSQRALEDRQLQVRDYYNHAVEQVTSGLFERAREQAAAGGSGTGIHVAEQGWKITARYDALGLQSVPRSMMAASSISFAGLRSTYRRDGFGAELVVVMEPQRLTVPLADTEPEERRSPASNVPLFSEMPAVNATAVLRFAGNSLEQILASRELSLEVYAPERTQTISMEGNTVPLAANFTAAYGLWLADAGFATESLRTLFGRSEGITQPHIYLMQPYDPDKRIIFLLHGLASSPEAWVNLVNEVTGDKVLRDKYQVWSVYYPTNAPVGLNRYTISRALNRTLAHFDPQGTAPASQDMVFVGHSMGGILARLMLSTPGDSLMESVLAGFALDDQRRERVQRRLGPILRYQPQANVSRAIFIASPHQGTDIANRGLGNFIGKLVRLPLTILGGFADVVQLLADPTAASEGEGDDKQKPRVPNSIDNLKATDPFIRAAAGLPLRSGLPYHSIIARRDPAVALEQSDDGLVPYWSAHLSGAQSEKVITAWHSVQETPEAVLEVRRILHEELAEDGDLPQGLQPATP